MRSSIILCSGGVQKGYKVYAIEVPLRAGVSSTAVTVALPSCAAVSLPFVCSAIYSIERVRLSDTPSPLLLSSSSLSDPTSTSIYFRGFFTPVSGGSGLPPKIDQKLGSWELKMGEKSVAQEGKMTAFSLPALACVTCTNR